MTAGTMALAQEQVKEVVKIANEKPPVRFGIKAGANAAAFSEQKLSIHNQKIGFNAGLFVNIPLADKISFQPEVLYNQMGAKSVITSNEVTTGSTTVKTEANSKVELNYISVPMMFQFRPAKSFYFEAGPEFSYFLDGKNKGETTITTTNGSTTATQYASASESIDKDDIKKFNVGLGLGVGLDITDNLGINARYISSLTHIADNSDVPEANKNINTNRVFQLGLSYKF